MTRIIFCVLFFTFTLIPAVKSQNQELDGSFISNDNKEYQFTINWPQDSIYDRFIVTIDGDRSEITVENAQSVRINNKFFYEPRAFVNLNGIPDTAFFEVLVKGNASLFYLLLNPEEFLFIDMKEYPMYLVSNKDVKVELNETEMKRIRPYANKLNYLMRECPGIQSRIARTNYGISSFVTLVDQYNKCLAGKSEFVNKPGSKELIEIGPLVMWGFTGFNMKNAWIVMRTFPIEQINFFSPISPALGVYMDLKSPKSYGRSSIRLNMYAQTYMFFSTNDPYLITGNSYDYEYKDFSTSFSDLHFNIMLTRYKTLKNSRLLNFEAGPYFGIPLDLFGSYIEYTETRISSNDSEEIIWRRDITHTSAFGLMAGIHYVIPGRKNKPLAVFAQGGVGTFSIGAKGTISYKMNFGFRADLF